MITDFDDLCLWTYVIVDDLLIELAPLRRRPGPAPDCSDSELIAMILVAECKGWNIETQLLSEFNQHPTMFPRLPCQSRFNRRSRNLGALINQIRHSSWQSSKGLKRNCVLLIVCRYRSCNFILRLRRQMIGRAMGRIMVESSQRNRPFSAINCIC